jgi:hypothetical protein
LNTTSESTANSGFSIVAHTFRGERVAKKRRRGGLVSGTLLKGTAAFMVPVGLSADPLARKLVALKTIAVRWRRLGSPNENCGRIGFTNRGEGRP